MQMLIMHAEVARFERSRVIGTASGPQQHKGNKIKMHIKKKKKRSKALIQIKLARLTRDPLVL